jgi:quinoprotein glucose dehydrogenase
MKHSPFILSSLIAALLPGSLHAVEQGVGAVGIAPASEEGKNAIPSFKHDPGLKIELWAAEPMLANPVAFTQDEKGRWYVAETFRQERGVEDNRAHKDWLDTDIAAKTIEDRLAMQHKFFPDAAKYAEKFTTYEDRIRRLEDTTGSGKADKATIFADGFKDALDGTGAGIIARGNEVWWTCIPNLWRFRDSNDDGVADDKEKLLTGFGVKFAFRGHDMHGLRFGPDGKLYWSIGDRAINVKSKEGKQVAETETGTIMRANPDGTDFEIFATGVRNPQELAFDEHGNLFTGDNNSDSGDKARFVYLVEGGDCGWRMAYQYLPDRGPWNREKLWDDKLGQKARYIVPPIANVGNGPSGLTYNPGTGLGEAYKNQFYLSDFRGGANASVVHQIALEPAGAFFKLKQDRDFVRGVLTTDVEFGNDGGLYVLDWVASWGGVGKGRIYKFTDEKADVALQKETQKLIADGMEKRPVAELAKLLGHADMRVRQAAQFELAMRGEVQPLANAAADAKATNPLGRLHGIWGLGQIAVKNRAALASVPALLGDADAEVRAQAAKVLGDFKTAAAGEKLTALLQDKESRVRFFAAISLGKIGHKPAVEALCKVLAENNDADPILRHGAIFGLAGTATAEQLAAKVSDPSAAVRGGVVVALRRQLSPLVAAFLKDADQSVVLEAARAIHDTPITEALPALAALTTNPAVTDPLITSRAINAHYRLGKSENARALAALAGNANAPESARKDALDALVNWADPDGKDRLLNQWRPVPNRGADDAIAAITPAVGSLLKDSPVSVQEIVAKIAAKFSIAGSGNSLLQLASNEKAGSTARIEAIRALIATKDAHLAEAAKVAVASKDGKVRAEGLQALAAADPAAAAKVIGEIIQNGETGEKKGAVLALADLKSKDADALLAGLIDQLIAGKLAPEIQLDVLESAKGHQSAEVKNKLAQYEASLPKDDPLAKWRVSLAGGNIEKGRKIFREKAETQCLRCHKNEIGDSLVGPELTHIGKTKDRAYLLESIVLPNKTIAQGFETVVLTLKDGNITAGRLVNQDANALKIETMDAQGKPQVATVAVAQIKERMGAPSPMPPNLTDFLSKSEMRDLIEYLATRK